MMASTLSLPRTLLRHLAARATQNPIEVVVSVFIIVTLAYFQLLHAVATSNFFEPLNTEARGLAAATTLSGDSDRRSLLNNSATIWESESSAGGLIFVRKAHSSQWIPLSEIGEDVLANSAAADSRRFDIEPILLADSEERPSPLLSELSTKIQSELFASSNEDDLVVLSYPLKDTSLNLSGYGLGRISSHSDRYPIQRKKLLVQANEAEFLQRTVNESRQSTVLKQKEASRLGLQLITIISDDDMHLHFPPSRLEELRSVRWMAYAVQALVMRIWALVQVS
jgi:hydroxymethylglutaryl-CoA reductase (NADPH)